MYALNNNVTYFDNFGVEHIPKEFFEEFPGNKNIKTNIFGIKAYDSIMWEYFYIGFIDFMLAGKTYLYLSFFTKWLYKNDDMILNYFMTNV